ncbi:hypothetical protein LINPERPRIM_LOCUS9409, partial [Linum perenne]
GLKWHAKRLKTDEEGDVADEFLDHTSSSTRFEAKLGVRQAKVKRQVMSRDGKLQHIIEFQGRKRLV